MHNRGKRPNNSQSARTPLLRSCDTTSKLKPDPSNQIKKGVKQSTLVNKLSSHGHPITSNTNRLSKTSNSENSDLNLIPSKMLQLKNSRNPLTILKDNQRDRRNISRDFRDKHKLQIMQEELEASNAMLDESNRKLAKSEKENKMLEEQQRHLCHQIAELEERNKENELLIANCHLQIDRSNDKMNSQSKQHGNEVNCLKEKFRLLEESQKDFKLCSKRFEAEKKEFEKTISELCKERDDRRNKLKLMNDRLLMIKQSYEDDVQTIKNNCSLRAQLEIQKETERIRKQERERFERELYDCNELHEEEVIRQNQKMCELEEKLKHFHIRR